MTFKEALLHEARQRPLLQPCDIAKLAFQAVRGGGHLIDDPLLAREALLREWQLASDNGVLYEPISNEYARVHLGAARAAGLSASTLFRLFIVSSKSAPPAQQALAEHIHEAMRLAESGALATDAAALRTFSTQDLSAGCPLMRHSEAYRAAYAPAYRIIETRFCRFLPLFIAIDQLLLQKNAPLIGIDGNAAAGKTTLAAMLAAIYPCNVVHTDHFFLPLAKRTEARFKSAGGNIDYERLWDEVLAHLPAQTPLSYRRFDCSTMAFAPQQLPLLPQLPVIVEGSYSLHPYFKKAYDLRVFVTLDSAAQQARIIKRNGDALALRFINEWIPMENHYFAECAIREGCDFVFCTQDALPQ